MDSLCDKLKINIKQENPLLVQVHHQTYQQSYRKSKEGHEVIGCLEDRRQTGAECVFAHTYVLLLKILSGEHLNNLCSAV